MAPSEATKLFQKLKLDTSRTKAVRVSSPLAAVESHVHHHSDRPSDAAVSDAIPIGAPRKDKEHAAPAVGVVGEDGVTDFSWSRDDGSSHAEAAVADAAQESAAAAAAEETVNSAEDMQPVSALESAFRSRQTSISFADKVTLDSGSSVSMQDPLPKPEVRRPRGRSALHELARDQQARIVKRTHSESERFRYDALTGRLMDNPRDERLAYHRGERRHPLLQSTVDDLAHNADVTTSERLASLTSETTISPVLEELRTPPDGGDFLRSPSPQSPLPGGTAASSSPIGFNSSHLPFSRRSNSDRSRSFLSEISTHGSLRRSARRTSTRSVQSSKSPAGAFLSKWSQRDEAVSAPQPDDEGQEIDQSGFIIGTQIGMGGFSVVKEVFSLENGQRVRRAVKIVRKQVEGKNEEENDRLQSEFEHEVSIWRYLRHRYILPLLAVYDSPFATFCITRLNIGGTLFDLVHTRRQKSQGGLPSNLAKRYVYQLASAVQYLHEEVRVVHRDIKLENVLVDMSGPDAEEKGGNVLLCDFGMADFMFNEHRSNSPEPPPNSSSSASTNNSANSNSSTGQTTNAPAGHLGPSQTSTSVTGSLRYAAPEMFSPTGQQLFSPAADVWALGIVIYALLAARLAFEDPYEPRVVVSIMAAEWDEAPLWETNAVKGMGRDGEEAVRLVRGCLQKEAEMRWGIADIVGGEWLRGVGEELEAEWDGDRDK